MKSQITNRSLGLGISVESRLNLKYNEDEEAKER